MKTAHLLCRAAACALVAAAAPMAMPAAIAQEAAAPEPASVAELVSAIDIPYEQFTLDNGLRVIVHTDRKAPIVAVSVWYDVGAKHEPEGETGFAHLFEHLMFNGSENAPGDFFAPLREVGATDLNGTTSFDRTNYFETVPRPALEKALYLESDRMGYLLGAVTQEVLDEQRGVVQNEKRQGDNQPYGLAWYSIMEGVFGLDHPYGHGVIGSMADLDAASLDTVKNWFRSHYGPNNAVLVLAGDIDAAEARPLVEKYFGAIERGPKSELPEITPAPMAETVKETMSDNVAATRIYRIWSIPGMTDEDAVPLQVAGGVLGGLSSSRLDNILVRKEKLAVSVSASADTMAQGGTFDLIVNVRPGVDPELVEQRLDEILADYLANGPTAEEVQRYATDKVSGILENLESVGGFGGKAVTLAEGALYADNPGFYSEQLDRLAVTTPEMAQAAAQKWLGQPYYQLTISPGEREAYTESQSVDTTPVTVQEPGPDQIEEASQEAPAEPQVTATRDPMPEVGQLTDLDFPDVTRTTLSNGVEVIYAHRDAVPVTQIAMSFDAGTVADPVDALGTQSLMLSVMDEGTDTMDSIALAEAKERLGAAISLGSSTDRTTASLSVPSPNLPAAVDLFADIVRNPAFAPEEVDRLRNQLLASISQELTSPQGLAMRALPGLVFGKDSPYNKLGAGRGDAAAVAELTPQDLVAFHDAWLRPDKAKIFVVSDLPLEQVTAALETGFGNWTATGEAGSKDFSAAAVQAPVGILLIDRPDSPQSYIVGGQLTTLAPRGELLPVFTANDVLGGDFLSRINMDLREEKHWSYGAFGIFRRLENAVSYMIIAPVQADKTGESIASLQREVTGFLTTDGITPEEFDLTIKGNIRELSGGFETSDSVLGAMQTNDLFGRPDDYYDTIAQKYRALSREELDAASREALNPDAFVWVVVGDAETVRPQLDSLGLPVEVISVDELAGTAPEDE
ncbi:M16 family metallopeptidase [Stakelama tenebrarum]|uniref:Insulinase family protein n=1 Tax=Stakelama tenebrarum TaxID=2711215 RepID=A0A6G6Y909_9SPHN|nr:pitrilysin family protein [Sphingosinithalassobacter tenebrarum]QIG81415.1 insulinase family protein [Sphingosinithalassobacter tenebrarum]